MGISSFLTTLVYNDLADNDTDAQSDSESTTPDEKSDIIGLHASTTAILPGLGIADQLETSIPDKAYAAE